MSTIEHITVPKESIKLLNHTGTQGITVTVDLIKLWERIKVWSDVYIRVSIDVPVIEVEVTKTMTLRLEKTIQVDALDTETPIVKLEATLPYNMKYDKTEQMSGKVSVMYYNIR